MNIENVFVHALRPYSGNARTHSKKQIRQIAESIKRFGFCNPVLIDDKRQIIAGHGRVEGAKLLGMQMVPVVQLSHLTDTEKRAYILADNKLAQQAGWNREMLAIELQGLIDLDFEVVLSGFETSEIDLILDEAAERQGALPGAEDQIPTLGASPTVSRAGDLWILGDHRLLCGDARDNEAYVTLLNGETAQLVFTDPPYNVRINHNVSGLGAVKHREFSMASGEMSGATFTTFLRDVFRRLAEATMDGSIHYICMDWRHIGEMITAGRQVYTELKNVCVWNKNNAGMGSFYRSKHELIFVWKNGAQPHINNFELGQYGRSRTNVWDYAGVNTFKSGRLDELAMHPTVKPVAMVADAIKDCSRRNGIVLDPFAGSGTTIIAAERTGRKAYAIEIDPNYVDVCVKRWQDYSGKEAKLAITDETYEEVEAKRLTETDAAGPDAHNETSNAQPAKEDA